MIKLIIAGGRDYNDYNFFKEKTAAYISEIQNGEPVQIVSGGANGVDKMGEIFAKENNLDLIVFQADWNKFGRGAGPQRNKQMADYGTHLLSYWNGESRGTKSMISLAEKKGVKVNVIIV